MAGTRIKVAADIPSDAGEDSLKTSSISTAGAQVWLDAFEAMMLAAGFVRTSDTGQLGAVAAYPSNTNDVGYRCYALSDEYSATSPLIIKATFAWRARGGNNTSIYRFRCSSITAGLATDGAGALTGATAPIWVMETNQMATSGITWRGNLKTYAWRKDYTTFCSMSAGQATYSYSDGGGSFTVNTGELFFAVSRLRDHEGNIDTSGFMLYGCKAARLGSNVGWQSDTYSALRSYRLTSAGVLNTGAGMSTLLGPSASYKLDGSSIPIPTVALQGRALDDSTYMIDGIYLYQGMASLTLNGLLTATGPDGDKAIAVVGYCYQPMDPAKYADIYWSRSSSSSQSAIYTGDQLFNTDCGIALDWSD